MLERIRRILRSETFARSMANAGWLLADKAVRMSVGFLVGVWIARHLGPADFGLWNFALSLTSLLSALASLGIDSVVIRELVRDPLRRDEVLGSAFALKLAAGSFCVLTAAIACAALRPGDTQALILVALSSAGNLFQSLSVIDLRFQSRLQSRYTVMAQGSTFLLATAAKIFLLVTGAPLLHFAIVGACEIAIGAGFLVLAYTRVEGSARTWRTSRAMYRTLLGAGWPVCLAGIASLVSMRLDQILVSQQLGERACGTYGAAVRLSELWFAIPLVLGSTIYPQLVEARQRSIGEYRRKAHGITIAMLCVVVPAGIVVTLASGWIVHLVYGQAYAEAASILSIHIWSGAPYVATFAYGNAFLIEGRTRLVLASAACALVANPVLNLLLIPKYGIQGAALATLAASVLAQVVTFSLLATLTPLFRTQRNLA